MLWLLIYGRNVCVRAQSHPEFFLFFFVHRLVMSNSLRHHGLYCQASLSMGFSRQEYWSGLPFPSPEDLPDPGIEARSPALRADSFLSESPGKPQTVS